jgi:hypothetical protein
MNKRSGKWSWEVQAEQKTKIEELQKRIDDALEEIYKEKFKAECEGYSKEVSDFVLGFGYDLHKILKGEINDH